jgi:acetolactate synthase-1/3 small subunit
MTIVVSGDDATLEQVRKQLQKLVPVVKVVDYQDTSYVERDLMLITVATGGETKAGGRRQEVVELANLFRAKIVDVSPEALMIELAGTEEKIEAFIDLVKPYGILEMARTGVIAMPRGRAGNAKFHKNAQMVQTSGGGTGIDPGDLPPG